MGFFIKTSNEILSYLTSVVCCEPGMADRPLLCPLIGLTSVVCVEFYLSALSLSWEHFTFDLFRSAWFQTERFLYLDYILLISFF